MIEPAFTFQGIPVYADNKCPEDVMYFLAKDEDLTEEQKSFKHRLFRLFGTGTENV